VKSLHNLGLLHLHFLKHWLGHKDKMYLVSGKCFKYATKLSSNNKRKGLIPWNANVSIQFFLIGIQLTSHEYGSLLSFSLLHLSEHMNL